MDVEALFHRYGPMVIRRCRKLLQDEEDAMDVAQEVFVRLLKNQTRLNAMYPSDLGTRNRFKPYLAASAGPYIGTGVEAGLHTGTKTTAAAGVQLGGGFDSQVTPYLMLGVRAGYNLIADFPVSLGGRDNCSGLELGIEISWLFGGR